MSLPDLESPSPTVAPGRAQTSGLAYSEDPAPSVDPARHPEPGYRSTSDPTWWNRVRAIARWRTAYSVVVLVLLTVLLARGVYRLDSLHNDFPSFYHPDERSKAEQLITDQRNFNHPQLMLEAALRVLPPLTPHSDVDATVKQARCVSAFFAATAAVLMAWAGYAAAGPAGFVACGLAVGLCPMVLVHAHYFKEDATLLAGIAAVLCAGAWLVRVRSPGAKLWATIGLGIAVGLAAAGKYCGVVMLGPALLMAVLGAWRHWGLMLAAPLLVTAIAGVTWLGIDYRCVADWHGFADGFDAERHHSTEAHRGLTMDTPNGYFADQVWSEAMPHIKALAVAGAVALLWHAYRGGRWAFVAWLIVTAGVYLAMLSYSVIPFYRYALPVTMMLYAFAALAVVWLAGLLPRRWRTPGVAVGVILIGLLQAVRCAEETHQFADDSRDALRDWANANLPANAVVDCDGYAGYGSNNDWFLGPATAKVRALRPTWAADLAGDGTPESLRRAGFTHVITAGSSCDRFTDPHVHAAPGDEAWFARHRAFYEAIKHYPVVWSRTAPHSTRAFTSPDLVVYRLTP